MTAPPTHEAGRERAKLSAKQLQFLRWAARGGGTCPHWGYGSTARSLLNRGLIARDLRIDNYTITEAGRAALPTNPGDPNG